MCELVRPLTSGLSSEWKKTEALDKSSGLHFTLYIVAVVFVFKVSHSKNTFHKINI